MTSLTINKSEDSKFYYLYDYNYNSLHEVLFSFVRILRVATPFSLLANAFFVVVLQVDTSTLRFVLG